MKFPEEAAWRPRPVFCCLRSEFRRKERRHSPHEAARNLPTTVRGEIDYCWGGLVDMCKDRYPRAGHVDGVCMRWAIPAMAPTVDPPWHDHHRYDTILGQADRNPLEDLDWPAFPGHFDKPWFLPLVGVKDPRPISVMQTQRRTRRAPG
jgi:hypothetical protein